MLPARPDVLREQAAEDRHSERVNFVLLGDGEEKAKCRICPAERTLEVAGLDQVLIADDEVGRLEVEVHAAAPVQKQRSLRRLIEPEHLREEGRCWFCCKSNSKDLSPGTANNSGP